MSFPACMLINYCQDYDIFYLVTLRKIYVQFVFSLYCNPSFNFIYTDRCSVNAATSSSLEATEKIGQISVSILTSHGTVYKCYIQRITFQIGPLTTIRETQCQCNHLTSFGSDFVVPPNSIDFNNVFTPERFLESMPVFCTVIAIILLYIGSLIWARREDKKDLIKVRKNLHFSYDQIMVYCV